jgi:hypothetical protein
MTTPTDGLRYNADDIRSNVIRARMLGLRRGGPRGPHSPPRWVIPRPASWSGACSTKSGPPRTDDTPGGPPTGVTPRPLYDRYEIKATLGWWIRTAGGRPMCDDASQGVRPQHPRYFQPSPRWPLTSALPAHVKGGRPACGVRLSCTPCQGVAGRLRALPRRLGRPSRAGMLDDAH